jgi:predicted dehydrogenase
MTSATKIAVIGVGLMGQRHARVLHALPEANLVAVADIDQQRANAVATARSCACYQNIEDLLRGHPDIEAVIIATPSSRHTEVAQVAINRGIPCFIEKPLASTLEDAENIAFLAAKSDTIVQVGHIERYNPAIKAAMDLQLNPAFIKIDRVSPMPFRSLDINVIMDLMIHDLDLMLSLTKKDTIENIDAMGVGLNGSPAHLAQARIALKSGCVADLTASRIALRSKRQVRIFTPDAYVSIDCKAKTAFLIKLSDYLRALEEAQSLISRGIDIKDDGLMELTEVTTICSGNNYDADYQLRAELLDFIASAKHKKTPTIDAQDALEAIRLADLIQSRLKYVNAAHP